MIKHIFYLWMEICFFIVFSMDYAMLRSTSSPLPSRHAPAKLAQLAVLNAGVALICDASEHKLPLPLKARSR